jgi:hypothetical protein
MVWCPRRLGKGAGRGVLPAQRGRIGTDSPRPKPRVAAAWENSPAVQSKFGTGSTSPNLGLVQQGRDRPGTRGGAGRPGAGGMGNIASSSTPEEKAFKKQVRRQPGAAWHRGAPGVAPWSHRSAVPGGCPLAAHPDHPGDGGCVVTTARLTYTLCALCELCAVQEEHQAKSGVGPGLDGDSGLGLRAAATRTLEQPPVAILQVRPWCLRRPSCLSCHCRRPPDDVHRRAPVTCFSVATPPASRMTHLPVRASICPLAPAHQLQGQGIGSNVPPGGSRLPGQSKSSQWRRACRGMRDVYTSARARACLIMFPGLRVTRARRTATDPPPASARTRAHTCAHER